MLKEEKTYIEIEATLRQIGEMLDTEKNIKKMNKIINTKDKNKIYSFFNDLIKDFNERFVFGTDLINRIIDTRLYTIVDDYIILKNMLKILESYDDNKSKFHTIDCCLFKLIPIRKFRHNLTKYSDIKSGMKDLKENIVEDNVRELNISMYSFKADGLVDKEIENQFKKVFKNKDDIIISLFE